MEKKTDKIITHYIKNHDFKTLFSSGVLGGLTVNGLINLNFCVDRTTIPIKTESEIVNIDGQESIKESKREGKEGLIKEVQFGTLMDVNVARETISLLQKLVKTFDELQKQLPKK